nr:type II toxin-antitoxin system HicA family toxin [Rhabdochromatium marinum]
MPRDLSGQDLIKRLERLDYQPTRQTGSHVRLTTHRDGQHHVTIPKHDPLRIGTLSSILNCVAAHHGLSRTELLELLEGKCFGL